LVHNIFLKIPAQLSYVPYYFYSFLSIPQKVRISNSKCNKISDNSFSGNNQDIQGTQEECHPFPLGIVLGIMIPIIIVAVVISGILLIYKRKKKRGAEIKYPKKIKESRSFSGQYKCQISCVLFVCAYSLLMYSWLSFLEQLGAYKTPSNRIESSIISIITAIIGVILILLIILLFKYDKLLIKYLSYIRKKKERIKEIQYPKSEEKRETLERENERLNGSS